MVRYRTAAVTLILVLAASSTHAAENDPSGSQPADRVFGVVPNYGTVEPTDIAPPLAPRDMFKLASLSSFDPFVYPLIGITATMQHPGSTVAAYRTAYVRALTDNAVGNYLTMAAMPAMFHQDPRYFALGSGSVGRRVLYALSRSVVTRTASGRLAFNVSEIGGNGLGAGLSNFYYGAGDRGVGGTMNRWGAQVLSDTLGNELKEFWPDIRRRLHKP